MVVLVDAGAAGSGSVMHGDDGGIALACWTRHPVTSADVRNSKRENTRGGGERPQGTVPRGRSPPTLHPRAGSCCIWMGSQRGEGAPPFAPAASPRSEPAPSASTPRRRGWGRRAWRWRRRAKRGARPAPTLPAKRGGAAKARGSLCASASLRENPSSSGVDLRQLAFTAGLRRHGVVSRKHTR